MTDVLTDPENDIRSKPLLELLRIAEAKGIIKGWSVQGPSIVLQRDESHVLVRAVDAGALLVRMMTERGGVLIPREATPDRE